MTNPKTIIGFGVGGFLVLMTLFLSYYTVPEGYRGVITRNAAVVGQATPGLGFKLPFVDAVTDMSIQTEALHFEAVLAYSRDIQQSASSVTVNMRLDPEHVLSIYSTVGTNYGEKVVWPTILRRFKEVFGKHAAAEIVNSRDKVGEEIHAAVADDLLERGIIIEAVQISNIDFSDAYEHSIEAAATAEADVKRARQELEQVKVNAQRQIAEAEAKATATRTTADAEAYATTAKGKAEASAILARAEAMRNAGTDYVALVTAEKWTGQLPATMVPSGAVPFLNVTGSVITAK